MAVAGQEPLHNLDLSPYKLGQAEMTCSLPEPTTHTRYSTPTTLHLAIWKPQQNKITSRNKLYQKVYLKQFGSVLCIEYVLSISSTRSSKNLNNVAIIIL